MSSQNNFEDAKRTPRDSPDVKERQPTATLHYGGPPISSHDFMYRPSLPLISPVLEERLPPPPILPQSPPGLHRSIYTCERCLHGFTHASDFLHHKAICMGNLGDKQTEQKMKQQMEKQVSKIIHKQSPGKQSPAKEVSKMSSHDIDFSHIARSINITKAEPSPVSGFHTSQEPTNRSPAKSPGSAQKFKCRYCDKEFEAMYIQSHELTHLIDSPDKPYSCDYCGRSFANLASCNNHERIHIEPRPYICTICNKGFMTAGIQKTHMLTHSGEKRFQCDICDKWFTTAGNLKTHKNIHKGEKPFNCTQCSKSFTTAGNLKTHEKIHVGLKPFTCSVCMKAFTTAGNLKTHENIHTGEKPFECDQCHKCFTTAGNLKTHYRLHTGERPYICQVCSQAYHSSANLRAHQKAVHGYDTNSEASSHSPRAPPIRPSFPHNNSTERLNSPPPLPPHSFCRLPEGMLKPPELSSIAGSIRPSLLPDPANPFAQYFPLMKPTLKTSPSDTVARFEAPHPSMNHKHSLAIAPPPIPSMAQFSPAASTANAFAPHYNKPPDGMILCDKKRKSTADSDTPYDSPAAPIPMPADLKPVAQTERSSQLSPVSYASSEQLGPYPPRTSGQSQPMYADGNRLSLVPENRAHMDEPMVTGSPYENTNPDFFSL